MQGTNEKKRIEKGLHKIRRSKIIAILLITGLIPFGIISFILYEKLNINFIYSLGLYVAFAMACSFYIGLTSKCPKCNELYYWRMSGIGFRNPWTKCCLNCGLELKEKKDYH